MTDHDRARERDPIYRIDRLELRGDGLQRDLDALRSERVRRIDPYEEADAADAATPSAVGES